MRRTCRLAAAQLDWEVFKLAAHVHMRFSFGKQADQVLAKRIWAFHWYEYLEIFIIPLL
jgi:hypothetical protein